MHGGGGGGGGGEWDKNNSENLKARSSFTYHSVLFPKFYR